MEVRCKHNEVGGSAVPPVVERGGSGCSENYFGDIFGPFPDVWAQKSFNYFQFSKIFWSGYQQQQQQQ